MAKINTVNEAFIVCNAPDVQQENAMHLNLLGKDIMNVRPQVNLFREYFKNPSDRIIDFIEVATFVYVADQCIVRCQDRVDPHGYLWRRRMNMTIAVRDQDFWSMPQTIRALEELLRFLSDDCFKFTFVKLAIPEKGQQYFVFDDKMCAPRKIERVMMFSGGLDSLGGAIRSLMEDGKQTVLVRHKSSSKHKERYEFLEKELNRRSGNSGTFFTIKTGKDKDLSHEYTQRCRSLLYFALGATISHLLGLHEVFFFENGPVSINLPMNPQVIGGRATRTTHPKTLHFFQKLFRLISDDDSFSVSNPFINLTKSEIVRYIIDQNCGDLIAYSMSCAHSWQQTKLQTHCGVCSQCIDRRVAIIAADAEEYDSVDDYAVDFFNEPVDKKTDVFELTNKNLLTSYFLRGDQIVNELNDYGKFEAAFPALFEAVSYMGKPEDKAAMDIYRLYTRLAKDIQKVQQKAVSPDFIRKEVSLTEHVDNTLTNILIRGGVQDTVEHIVKVEDELPDYAFVNEGGAWRLRYKSGKKQTLIPSRGCYFLGKLLASPHKRLDLDELEPPAIGEHAPIDVEELLNNFETGKGRGGKQDAIDERTKIEVGKKLKEEIFRRDEARRLNDEKEEEEANIQVERLTQYLNANLQKNGKPRNINKANRRQGQAIADAIKTVIKNIEVFNQPFAEHLRASLSFGNNPIYAPKEDITWYVILEA